MNIDDIMNGDVVGVPTVVLNRETYSVDEVVVEGTVVGFTESGAILEYDSDGEPANTIAAEFAPVPVTEGFLKWNGFEEDEDGGNAFLRLYENDLDGAERVVVVTMDGGKTTVTGVSGDKYIRIDSDSIHELQHVMHALGFRKKLKPVRETENQDN